jgi:pyruvate kinase
MNCARINCAHDHPDIWARMIENIHTANEKLHKKCKIAMDLAGPKLRSGQMIPGPKVVRIKPQRDDLGKIIQPARIWIAPPHVSPPLRAEVDAVLPVHELLFKKIKRGNTIEMRDSRGKKGHIFIDRKEENGKWGLCSNSLYVETGTELVLQKQKQTGDKVSRLGEVLPKEQFITLCSGDKLILHKDPRLGEAGIYDEDGQLLVPAHISCTLPEIFDDVQPGEPVFFNDGKIDGLIKSVNPDEIEVDIIHAKKRGSKLKADTGINLPESTLSIGGLTEKDKVDINFVAKHADAINFSFVNNAHDVQELQKVLEEKNSAAGIILKIETKKGFANLPAILLTAMRCHPVGVMIARGDLAIETGWENFAAIQLEIMRICGAAHVPDVWATQVLDNLAKKGTPSRSEITDAAMAQQADCVMLNKGPYIIRAVKMLDKILCRMERFQNKTSVVLPKMEQADQLMLSY